MTARNLWSAGPTGDQVFELDACLNLPAAAQLYLSHSIRPGSTLARAVLLEMHGEIKLKGWSRYTAKEAIVADRGIRWEAKSQIKGLPVSGFEEIVDGEGRIHWKLLGIFTVASDTGPDLTRSAAGRFAAEAVWMPSMLALGDVSWTAPTERELHARVRVAGQETELILGLAPSGALQTILFERWGNPNGGPFGLFPFGGYIEEEETFGDYTIPSRLRLGWHFGTPRFESEGEFFRATIDSAEYR